MFRTKHWTTTRKKKINKNNKIKITRKTWNEEDIGNILPRGE